MLHPSLRGPVLAVALAAGGCAAGPAPVEPRRPALAAPRGGDWDAQGPVVAVGVDGGLLVGRGATVDVFGPTGARRGALPLGPPADDASSRFALAAGGRTVAFVADDGSIELWDVASRTRRVRMTAADALRAALPAAVTGNAPPPSWGPPRFLDDGRLVTHHQGGIVVWTPAGAVARVVVDPALGLVRDSLPLPDPDLLQLRCSSTMPGITNASEYVVSLTQGRVVDRVAPDRSGIQRFPDLAVWISDDFLHTYVWLEEGTSLRRVVTQAEPALLTVSADRAQVAWVEQGEGAAAGGLKVLDRATGRLHTLSGERTSLRALRFDGPRLVTVSERGAVRHWPVPRVDGDAPGALVAVTEDPRERTWQSALVALGLGDGAGAARMTAAFRAADVPPKYLVGALYLRAQEDPRRAAGFRAACEAMGIRFTTPAAQEALVALADDLARAQSLLSADLLTYWLASSPPAGSPTTTRALRLAADVLLMLSEANQFDLRQGLLGRLSQVFPDDPLVRAELETQP